MGNFKLKIKVELVECDDTGSGNLKKETDGSFTRIITEDDSVSIDKCESAMMETVYPTALGVTLRLDASVTVEIVTPANGAELTATGATLDVAVTVRAPGIAADDTITVRIDGAETVGLARSGTTLSGTAQIPGTSGEHELSAEVTNAAGQTLAETSTRFTVTNTDDIPLEVVRQEPENVATGVEPNAFVAFFFNRPINPDLFSVVLRETAHGKTYAEPEPGADITSLSKVELVDVHRDLEQVPGGIGHLPENTMAAFYPKRDFAYGGNVYVTVLYDSAELWRSTFNVRPLPTFIQGFVADHFLEPLGGIEVEIPDLGRKAVTDGDGCHGFGFGDKAEEVGRTGRRKYRKIAGKHHMRNQRVAGKTKAGGPDMFGKKKHLFTFFTFFVILWTAFADNIGASGGDEYVGGTIAAKGPVLDEDGNRIWVEYNEGRFANYIHAPDGSRFDQNSVVMQAGEYRAYVDAFLAVQNETGSNIEILARAAYEERQFFNIEGLPR